MIRLAVVLGVLCCAVHVFSCETGLDCQMNGICTAGVCSCDPIWTGENCTELAFKKDAIRYMDNGYGQSTTANISTWGGNALQDDDGVWHLFAAEMAYGCPLASYNTNSQISHAVATNPEGPYTFKDVAVPLFSHNPQVLKYTNASSGETTYVLFHIGSGTTGRAPQHCDNTNPLLPNLVLTEDASTGSNIHVAKSLDGPWTPLKSGIPTNCDNPSPIGLRNGTWLLVCGHADKELLRSQSPSPFGPYVKVSDLPSNADQGFTGPSIRYEDSFIFEDPRGGIHVLFHVYNNSAVCTPHCSGWIVSGHDFSEDGVTWHSATVEPFDNTYTTTNGTIVTVSTRERPKFLYNKDGVPTHLVNGVSNVPSCPSTFAARCKRIEPGSWTYTLIAPLVTA